MSSLLEAIPVERRDAVSTALRDAFGATPLESIAAIVGGASALTYRIEVGGRAFALRLEATRPGMRDPAQGYACLALAAQAGVAPALRHADAALRVAVIDFVPPVPLDAYPGGPEALARASGSLIGRLQDIAEFPTLGAYRAWLERILLFLTGPRLFAPGLLEQHSQAFERLAAAYPWDAEAKVGSHNDPNPRNIIFDGSRLWLIDWEASYRNDPLVDIAILANELAPTPAAEAALLAGWRPGPRSPQLGARLMLMRQFVRLYYAGLLLSAAAFPPPPVPVSDLSAPSVAEFTAMVGDGRLRVGSPDLAFVLGKMHLAAFLAWARGPLVARALADLGAR